MNDSILLSIKGIYLILASGALSLATVIAEATEAIEPTALIRSLESLGPQGLLLAGIIYLYRANQKLEAEIKKMHEDAAKAAAEHKAASDAHLELLREQVEESNKSRDRLYNAIRGNLGLKNNSNDED